MAPTTPMVKKGYPEIRFMLRRDLPQVVAIDELNNDWDGWGEKNFFSALREKKINGMVCEFDKTILGFIVYELDLEEKQVIIKRLEVLPTETTTKVFDIFVDEMKAKMNKYGIETLKQVIPDNPEYIDKHKFYAKKGWKSRVKRDFFKPQGGDGYEFTLKYDGECEHEELFNSDFKD